MGLVADNADIEAPKTPYVDNGWPTTNPDDHAVSELATDRVGAADELPYVHPVTEINR
jgi:hypothetical protein